MCRKRWRHFSTWKTSQSNIPLCSTFTFFQRDCEILLISRVCIICQERYKILILCTKCTGNFSVFPREPSTIAFFPRASQTFNTDKTDAALFHIYPRVSWHFGTCPICGHSPIFQEIHGYLFSEVESVEAFTSISGTTVTFLFAPQPLEHCYQWLQNYRTFSIWPRDGGTKPPLRKYFKKLPVEWEMLSNLASAKGWEKF